jgi:ubiquinone biosynthesis O-methyltransferase
MSTAKQQPIDDLSGLGPDAYARWRTSEVGAITERLERRLILDLIGDVRDRCILDVGCGDGDLAVDLAKRGARVIGVDASAIMIEAAMKRASRERVDVDFRIGTAQDLPIPPEQIDVVVAVTILCFVENAAPVFQEMARVLRPGGHLVIGELGKWSSWAAARRVRGWLGSTLWRQGRFRTPKELRSLAFQADLTVETVRGAIYYPRWGWAARILAPYDPMLSRATPVGAAFLALRATKSGMANQAAH